MAWTIHRHDVLILGSGAAGLSLALCLPDALSVAVVSKRELREGSTLYAQGGISAVLDAGDSIELHVQDTLKAGAGLCDRDVVRHVVERGPDNIRWLLDQEVEFIRDTDQGAAGGYHLTREGGHTHRRVIHAADATGRAVATTLEVQVRARPNVTLYEQHIAVDLITTRHLSKPEDHRCLELGIDITREPIPVVPAAHYTCGGVMVDRRARTDLPGLYASGETAYTGLHGANRMASNSLLECLVYSEAAAADIVRLSSEVPPPPDVPNWDESRVTEPDEEVVVTHNWEELRRFMWDYVGIVRTNKRLRRAKRRADLLAQEVIEYYSHFRGSNDLIELRNLLEVADLIIQSALRRRESRGLHYTLDHSFKDASQRAPTILIPDGYQPARGE